MSSKIDYLYEIILYCGKRIFLTSSTSPVKINDKIFYPSGVTIKEIHLDDSAQNYILLEGIYEENSISSSTDLNQAEFTIYTYDHGTSKRNFFFNYFYSNHTNIDNMYFIIKLTPLSDKLQRTLIKLFRKTCRADFADKSCTIDIAKYEKIYKILSLESNIINLEECKENTGYFDGGFVYFPSFKKKFIIERQIGSMIRVIGAIAPEYSVENYIKLYPICDKQFITCCKKFNNAVNFRGEPFAPTYLNLLK